MFVLQTIFQQFVRDVDETFDWDGPHLHNHKKVGVEVFFFF